MRRGIPAIVLTPAAALTLSGCIGGGSQESDYLTDATLSATTEFPAPSSAAPTTPAEATSTYVCTPNVNGDPRYTVAADAVLKATTSADFEEAEALLDEVADPGIYAAASHAIEVAMAADAALTADRTLHDMEAAEDLLEEIDDDNVRALGERAVDLDEAAFAALNGDNSYEQEDVAAALALIEDPAILTQAQTAVTAAQQSADNAASLWYDLNTAGTSAWYDLDTQATGEWYDLYIQGTDVCIEQLPK